MKTCNKWSSTEDFDMNPMKQSALVKQVTLTTVRLDVGRELATLASIQWNSHERLAFVLLLKYKTVIKLANRNTIKQVSYYEYCTKRWNSSTTRTDWLADWLACTRTKTDETTRCYDEREARNNETIKHKTQKNTSFATTGPVSIDER